MDTWTHGQHENSIPTTKFAEGMKNYFMNTIRLSNYMDPFQAQCSVGLIWVQTVCKGYHKTTNSPLAPIKAIVGIKCCDIFYNSQRIQGGHDEPRFIFF